MASADINALSRPFWQDPSSPSPPRARPTTNTASTNLDDLFNYDFDDINNVSRTANAEAAEAGPAQLGRRNIGSGGEDNGGLGIDEEVKVRKRRAPIAKLDEERLLSANGIPKLRRIAKERMKFKGKGHEFSDVARMLNMYQLWLDDLFPKAKFADGLAIIEKLGHKKRLQVMRKEWIDEEKPKPVEFDLSDDDSEFVVDKTNKDVAGGEGNAGQGVAMNDESTGQTEQNQNQDDDDDDLYAEHTPVVPTTAGESGADTNMRVAEEPEEDELDALLAEEEGAARPAAAQPSNPAPQRQQWDDFADDEDAMKDMW